ncbi:MAG: M20/M25/M40 family metallo-hydrolase [Thermoleophilia bacterium]|nr:M20/M25/M40 family metallo-hydrolase [Thermoleophilia bacterium]
MPVPELLDRLLRAHGPSGHEHLAFDVVREAVDGVADVETDSVGNLVARRRADGPLLALFAHLDVIGAAVAHVADDGLLAVHQLGSWRANVAYGQRVEIRTSRGPVPGVIARKVKDNEKVEWGQLYVDVGAKDGEDARALVATGDPIVVDAPPVEIANGRLVARTLDNRAGVYVALEVLRRAAGANVAVVAAAQEELGAYGAQAAAHGLRPDVAIAIDVTYATDVPGDDPATGGHHVLGGGAAIFRGPAINPRVFELLAETAREEGIAHTIEAGMKTYTDADATFAAGEGIPTGVVSIPLRNMHSPIEIVELGDLEACIELLRAFAARVRPDETYAR